MMTSNEILDEMKKGRKLIGVAYNQDAHSSLGQIPGNPVLEMMNPYYRHKGDNIPYYYFDGSIMNRFRKGAINVLFKKGFVKVGKKIESIEGLVFDVVEIEVI